MKLICKLGIHNYLLIDNDYHMKTYKCKFCKKEKYIDRVARRGDGWVEERW